MRYHQRLEIACSSFACDAVRAAAFDEVVVVEAYHLELVAFPLSGLSSDEGKLVLGSLFDG